MQRQRIQTPAGVVAQDTIVMQDIGTGFDVTPRIAGTGSSSISVRSAKRSELSAPWAAQLGEWFALGAVSEAGSRDDRSIGAASASRTSETRRVWVKVEEIGN